MLHYKLFRFCFTFLFLLERVALCLSATAVRALERACTTGAILTRCLCTVLDPTRICPRESPICQWTDYAARPSDFFLLHLPIPQSGQKTEQCYGKKEKKKRTRIKSTELQRNRERTARCVGLPPFLNVKSWPNSDKRRKLRTLDLKGI